MKSNGFTLLEVIVVVAIIGLASTLVLTHGRTRSERIEMEAAERALVGTLRLARGQAIANDRVTVVRTSLGGFGLDGGVPQSLPQGLTLSPGSVLFTPDGQSSGGRIVLRASNEIVTVTVDWLTGRVAFVTSSF